MEFTMSSKSKTNWQDLMAELGVESQMRPEDVIKKHEKERIEKEIQEKKHLEHLKKYHFRSKKEVLDYIYSGHEMIEGESGGGFHPDRIKLMDDGSIGHWSLWLSDDDCVVLGYFWRSRTKEKFEAWLDKIFDSNNNYLDHGYFPLWHKIK